MTQTILIILGLVVIVLLLRQKTRERVVGICAAATGVDTKKRENNEKILELLRGGSASASAVVKTMAGKQGFGETKELSNSDIREALGVSERSVTRYMEELEKEGKVEQVGNTGRSVSYRLRPQKTQQ